MLLTTRERFAGVLEAPLAAAPPCRGERLVVQGWALCERPIERIDAVCDSRSPALLRHGMPRPDVAAAYGHATAADAGRDTARQAGFANLHQAGFTGVLNLAGLAPGEHRLEVRVHGADGMLHCWQRSIHIADPVAAYQTWRQQVLAQALAVCGDPGSDEPVATWLVERSDDSRDDELAATLASLHDESHRARFAAIVVHTGQPLPPIATAFAGRLRAGDRLVPGAATLVAALMRQQPALDLIYADHDRWRADGAAHEPVLKPGWSSLLAEHEQVEQGPWLLRLDCLGTGRDHPPGAGLPPTGQPPISVWPRLAQAARHARQVAQIPLPLLSISRPIAPTAPIAPLAPKTAVQANATQARPAVSVIVPTCLADPALLARCLDGLREHTTGGAALDIVVVLNNLAGVGMAQARALLARWSPVIVEHEGSFNWSTLNNLGARAASGDWLLFLNDDVEPVESGWLDAMLRLAARPGVGAVGAVLRYPDGSLQHAGVTIDAAPLAACRHRFRGCSGSEPRVARWLASDRMQTAVTGACLLSARDVFERIGGFDPALPIACNDIDYCLRLRQAGLGSAVAAAAVLLHHEGRSRGGLDESADQRLFQARWSPRLPRIDAFSHPALADAGEDWTLAFDSPPAYEARISMTVEPDELRPHDTDQHWRQWGERDPYYAVITHEMFRRDKLDPAALRLFFKSGRAHAKHVLAVCKRHFDPAFVPSRVLDFGCGVGRLLVGFAEWADEIVGVDISQAMLDEARKNCDARGLQNIVLLRSDDQLSQVQGQFDLVHSTIVLQHIDPRRGCELFGRLVERVKPGGLGSLHLTYAKAYWPEHKGQAPATAPAGPASAAVHAAANADRAVKAEAAGIPPPVAAASRWRWRWPFLTKRAAAASAAAPAPAAARAAGPAAATAMSSLAASPLAASSAAPRPVHADPEADPEIQMNIYPLNEVFYLAQTAGIREMHVEFSDHGGELGVVLFFRRPPA
ncbi:methyltransferase domain-containing protein [Aquabacterium sp.]|uniref:methyltransferase domain-containing protein n=1 Tax=Aquabacterium sp. TaxID=1872578 RepID=UPI002D07E279|nr:methyltransferase domain-containing protein [Aquabacterium sp.]HSW07415.1 methyltransferase domain-containing protein [Aquabacterium sp.]